MSDELENTINCQQFLSYIVVLSQINNGVRGLFGRNHEEPESLKSVCKRKSSLAHLQWGIQKLIWNKYFVLSTAGKQTADSRIVLEAFLLTVFQKVNKQYIYLVFNVGCEGWQGATSRDSESCHLFWINGDILGVWKHNPSSMPPGGVICRADDGTFMQSVLSLCLCGLSHIDLLVEKKKKPWI